MHWFTFSGIYSLVQRVISFLSEGVAAGLVQYRYRAASVAETAFQGLIVYHCHRTGTVLDYGVSIMAQHRIMQFRAPNPTLLKLRYSTLCYVVKKSFLWKSGLRTLQKLSPVSSPQQHGQYNSSFYLYGIIPWRKV